MTSHKIGIIKLEMLLGPSPIKSW